MLIRQLVKDRFGQHYKIHTSKEAPVQVRVKPEQFHSDLQASRFIDNLIVPVGFWKNLYYTASLTEKPVRNDANITARVAALFSSGKIKAYKIDIHSHTDHPPSKRTITDGKKNRHIFIPASALLVSKSSDVITFNNKSEAHKYLAKLSPDKTTLQTMVHELKLPRPSKNDDHNELMEIVASGMASGDIFVFLDQYTTPPASSGSTDSSTSHGDKKASQGPETPNCTFDTMTVQCSHGRSYMLDVIKDKPNLNGVDKALQVISKHGEPDEITVTYSGSCAYGSKECPAIKISSDTLNGTFTDKPYKFGALPLEKEREPGDLIDFLKYYLVPDLSGLDYQVYTIEKSGCSGSEGYTAKVHAFPSFKWEGSASLGYEQTDGTNNDGKKFGQKEKKSEFGLKLELKGNVGKKDWAYETSTKRDAERYMPGIQNTMRGLIYKLDDYRKADNGKGLVRFSVTWPSIAIGGNIELLEDKNDFSGDIGGEVYLKLDPLIKADIRTDILEWLISFTAIGPFLQKVKSKAADGVGSDNLNAKAVIAIDLVVTGEAAAELKWKKSASEKWLSTSGDKTLEAKAGVTFGLEAKVKAEAKIFYVKITMGAELHVKGAGNTSEGIGVFLALYATTEKDKPAVGGKVNFTGAAIYYTYYAEVGNEAVESDAYKKQNAQRGGNSNYGRASNREHKLKEDRMMKLTEIFAADEWPKGDKGSTNLPDLQ